MVYLYDNELCNDLQSCFVMPDGAEPVVRVIDPEHIVGLAAQIQNDEISLPLITVERKDYSVDTDRTNFTRSHFGVATVIDNKTNEIYYERAIPIDLQYTLHILTSNQIDMDEIVKELLFKYTYQYFLTIKPPYESKNKYRFGIRLDTSAIEKQSGASEYIESGKLYHTSIPLICDGAVLLHYTPARPVRYEAEVIIEDPIVKP